MRGDGPPNVVASRRVGGLDGKPGSSRDQTTGSGIDLFRRDATKPSSDAHALVIAYCHHQPERVGEIAFLPQGLSVLGRGGTRPDDTIRRLSFDRRRPTTRAMVEREGPELLAPRISREQLRFRVNGTQVEVERTGKCPLKVKGETVNAVKLVRDDTLVIDQEMVLLLVHRPVDATPLPNLGTTFDFPFGEPDAFGMVGESVAAWSLRDRVAFAASCGLHVVLFGESGVGKELVARAIHALSKRSTGPLVSRNAATLPAGLIDAELFGNVRNYPNVGMEERLGLVGEAHGGSLFLDEIAELAEELQAHILRLLDGGEYQRLGDAKLRKSDLRLIAATNRDESALKHDLLARLKLAVHVAPLNQRRDDIPILIRHLLATAAQRNQHRIVSRFFDGSVARVEPALVEALLRHRYALNVRELESLLWTSMASSPHDFLALTGEVRERLDFEQGVGVRADEITAEAIEDALSRHQGNQSRAYKDLGLRTRDQLYRLMKKLGVSARK